MIRRYRDRWKHRSLGQSLPELALVLPVLLLILGGGLDVGRLFLGWVELNNAARIAANYAALHPFADWSNPTDPDRVRYEQLVSNEADALGCTLVSPLPPPAFPGTKDLGQPANASFSCSFDILMPFIGAVTGDPMTLSASSNFPIRFGGILGVPVGPVAPTPTPTPDPSASEDPSPPPPPPPCTAPNYINSKVSVAQADWATELFTGTFTAIPGTPADYNIKWQSMVAGQAYPCTNGITVAKTAP